MKKLIVYPFTKEMSPLVRYRSMLREYELIAAIPPKGYGWEGKDVCEIDGGVPTAFIVGGDFKDKVEHCDAVFFNTNGQNSEKELALTLGKEIVTTIQSNISEPEIDIHSDLKLKEIPVPVVMVLGLGENCQKFDIQLGLRDEFMKAGYKVSQFGTKSYSKLFGFESLPDIPETSLWKKVHIYNHLFRETYKREKPDVMIIGIPGGIMPITSYTYERFGETALAVAYAAKPDITLLSYYYLLPTHEYFEMLRQFARFRLGAGSVFFHVSNTNLINRKDTNDLSYLTLESQFVLGEVSQNASEMPPYLFNALCPDTSKPAYINVIEKLRQNVCVAL